MMVVECLLVTSKEAAKLLSISERNLWTLTRNGTLVAVRIGGGVRYSVEELRAWIRRQVDPEARRAWLESTYPGILVDDNGEVVAGCAGEVESWQA